MTYSIAALHSACLKNNEGGCCINLCNGEHEEGRAVRQEGEKKREERCAHAAALQLFYTLAACAHAPARTRACVAALASLIDLNTKIHACVDKRKERKRSMLKRQPNGM